MEHTATGVSPADLITPSLDIQRNLIP